MANNGRYTTLLLYEALEEALKALVAEDEQVLSWPKGKISYAHCLAGQLQLSLRRVLGLSEDSASPTFFSLPSDVKVDIFVKGMDVLVHDRKGKNLMGLVFSTDYLSKAQQDLLHQKQAEGCRLVLGAAFLPQKEYILLYRPKQESMEYLHFNRYDGTTTLLKQRELESQGEDLQLVLGIKEQKKRKKRISEPGQ